MLDEQKIKEIIDVPEIVITKVMNHYVKGIITDPETQKKSKFIIIWEDEHVILRIIKGKDESLVKTIAKILSTDYIKGEVNSWTGKEVLYSWFAKEEKRNEALRSLQLGCALNTGIFSFLGWQDVQLISA